MAATSERTPAAIGNQRAELASAWAKWSTAQMATGDRPSQRDPLGHQATLVCPFLLAHLTPQSGRHERLRATAPQLNLTGNGVARD